MTKLHIPLNYSNEILKKYDTVSRFRDLKKKFPTGDGVILERSNCTLYGHCDIAEVTLNEEEIAESYHCQQTRRGRFTSTHKDVEGAIGSFMAELALAKLMNHLAGEEVAAYDCENKQSGDLGDVIYKGKLFLDVKTKYRIKREFPYFSYDRMVGEIKAQGQELKFIPKRDNPLKSHLYVAGYFNLDQNITAGEVKVELLGFLPREVLGTLHSEDSGRPTFMNSAFSRGNDRQVINIEAEYSKMWDMSEINVAADIYVNEFLPAFEKMKRLSQKVAV